MSNLSGTPYTESSAQGARIVGDDLSEHSGPGPDVMAASTLTSDAVRNSAGENLGKIEDIMLDVRRGQIAYAVLSFGGFLGVGSKLFAVPWSALMLDTDNECFVLDVSKERLKEAPGFDKDHWPSMADAGWQSEVNTYYGRPAYWE
jgi:sporulation protein YlmC with PRC-barrel domain